MSRICFTKIKKIFLFSLRNYSSTCIYNEEFTVSPFCNLYMTSPFNVKIRPLDVHQYPNCDKLLINVQTKLPDVKANVSCVQDNLKFSILGQSTDSVDCNISVPIKSDINIVTTQNGSINIKKIHGERIVLQTDTGEIVSENCQTSKIIYNSNGGDITSNGTLHAGEIELATKNNAVSQKISLNHIQALKACVITENGNIIVKSSYCDDTTFQSKRGKLILENIHKNCSIIIIENGSLNMTGFDGTLNADIMEGDIDIQASKLYDLSKITLRKKNNLLLRLSDWIQENTQIKTACQQLKMSDEVRLVMKNKDVYALLSPKNYKFTSELDIDANLSNICIEGASWSDMLKLKGIRFTE